jgi:cell division protein FtsW
MAAERTKKKNTLWNFLDNLEGDKVVWMIVLLLMLISIVAIFSSTSQLALQKGTTRMSILKGQMMTIVGGLAVILVCYSIKSLRFFRFFSQFGYMVSILMLLILFVEAFVAFVAKKTTDEEDTEQDQQV